MISIEAEYVAAAIGIGIGATLIMDLWNQFRYMPQGIFRHESITAATPKRFECAVGWLAHYTIGVVLALIFVVLAGDWLAQPTLLPALVYGLIM